jgi:EAL domain-containing protein (putative c-di-GMP-specific phosphodiesterase class I)
MAKLLDQCGERGSRLNAGLVRDMLTSGKDRLLVKTMIAMGHDLGYRVVAEGIETQAAFDLLAEWGCDEEQGYLMAEPMAAGELFRRPPTKRLPERGSRMHLPRHTK